MVITFINVGCIPLFVNLMLKNVKQKIKYVELLFPYFLDISEIVSIFNCRHDVYGRLMTYAYHCNITKVTNSDVIKIVKHFSISCWSYISTKTFSYKAENVCIIHAYLRNISAGVTCITPGLNFSISDTSSFFVYFWKNISQKMNDLRLNIKFTH